MLKKISFAILVLAALASCKSKTAYNYSQNFVTKERSLNADIESTEEKVGRYAKYEQFDSIAVAGERMEKLVDSKLQEVKDEPAPDVKEGANFKAAAIKYFEFIKSMYTAYKAYGNAKTPEERDEKLNAIRTIVDQKPTVIADIQSAQKKYADANGFKIENK